MVLNFPFISLTSEGGSGIMICMVLCRTRSIVRSVMTCAEIKVIGHSDRGSCRSQKFSAIYNLTLICRFLITLRWLLLTHKKFNRFRLDCTSRYNNISRTAHDLYQGQVGINPLEMGIWIITGSCFKITS